MRNENHKQYSGFTVPRTLADRLEAYMQENHLSRNAAIGNLIELGLLNDAQTMLPERAGDIEDFLMHQQAQVEAYRKALECIKDADARARAGVAHQLDTLSVKVDENEKLRAENERLKARCEEMRGQLHALGSVDQIKKEREELAVLRLQTAELQNELATKTLEYSQRLEEERSRVFSIIETLSLK